MGSWRLLVLAVVAAIRKVGLGVLRVVLWVLRVRSKGLGVLRVSSGFMCSD